MESVVAVPADCDDLARHTRWRGPVVGDRLFQTLGRCGRPRAPQVGGAPAAERDTMRIGLSDTGLGADDRTGLIREGAVPFRIGSLIAGSIRGCP